MIGITFINFDRNFSAVFGSCARCIFPTVLDQDARTTDFYNITYINCPRKAQWGFPFKAIFRDRDGTLTGKGKVPVNGIVKGGYASPYFPHNHIPGVCDSDPEWEGGVICDANLASIRRMSIYDQVQASVLNRKDLRIKRDNSIQNISSVEWQPKEDPNEAWAFPMATGQSYNIWFQGYADFDQFHTRVTNMEDDDYFYVRFNYTDRRDHFEVYRTDTWEEIAVSTFSLPDPHSPSGSSYHNVSDKSFTLLYSGKGRNTCCN